MLLKLLGYGWHLIPVQDENQASDPRPPLLDAHTPELWLHLQSELLCLGSLCYLHQHEWVSVVINRGVWGISCLMSIIGG